MKRTLLALAAVAAMSITANADVVYPAGASAKAIAADKAARASAAVAAAKIAANPNCVSSQDHFVTCDPDGQVRLNWSKGVQTQGSGF